MQINADMDVTYGRSHKEEYIEEDVQINDVSISDLFCCEF